MSSNQGLRRVSTTSCGGQGSRRYCLPRHRMPLNSTRNDGSNCLSTTQYLPDPYPARTSSKRPSAASAAAAARSASMVRDTERSSPQTSSLFPMPSGRSAAVREVK